MSYSPKKNMAWMFGKLSEGLAVIVAHPGDARHRVWSAARYLLMVDPEAMPEPVRGDVAWIRQMLKRCPAELGRSALTATYYRTKNVTASKIASRVFDAYVMTKDILNEQRKRRSKEAVRYEVHIGGQHESFEIPDVKD